METTFYLKYRPQTFADLDSSSAREELFRIFSSGRISHAFLFTGTKGIGKTSAARIIAKSVNCEERAGGQEGRRAGTKGGAGEEKSREAGKLTEKIKSIDTIEPCNKCSSCVSITNGSNVDVLEIDAASYTGVDDIRDLREKVKLAPTSAKYKVYIIDEVHRLSGSAFDALLKTLEEPPKHVIFVLCTTELEKVPKTIVSRCQRIAFKKATLGEITERLKKICGSEKLDFEDKALLQIARLSDGSFRDATKILEQLSFSGKITTDEVEKTVGILGLEEIAEFLSFLKLRRIRECLVFLNKAAESGASLKIFTENLLEQLRNHLLANFGLGENEKADFSIEESEGLIELFSKACSELRFAVIPQLPLEMAVIEWGEKGENKDSGLKIKEPTKNDGMKQNREGESEKLDEEVKGGKSKEASSNSDSPLPASGFTLDEVISKWPLILGRVKPLNHSVLAFLKASRPVACDGNYLTLEVFYKFHKDQLETEKCRRIFEQAAGEILISLVKLRCVLSQEKPKKIPPPPLPPVESKNTGRAAITKEEEIDIIKVAEEIFNN